MILFCDTSALVKLYLREEGSDEVARQATASTLVGVCAIAWVELMSAFARRSREDSAAGPTIAAARQRAVADWPHFLTMEITRELVELAGDYADVFALRAYDSVQLAALRLLERELPGEVIFACFDTRLVKAARALGVMAMKS